MARSRLIKPGFFKNETLAELGPWAQLLFAGLWTLADREGRLEDRPIRIQAEIFPYRFQNVEVDEFLGRLASGPDPFIIRYEAHQKRYIQIINFEKHNKPHHQEQGSNLPPLPKDFRITSEDVPKSNGSNPSLNLNPLPLNLKPVVAASPPASRPVAAPVVKRDVRNLLQGLGKPVVTVEKPVPVPREETPLAKLLTAVKILQGAEDDPEWNRVYFARYARPGTDLLRFFGGDWKMAGNCLEDIVDWLNRIQKTWTLETIIKHAPEWKRGPEAWRRSHAA